MNQEMTYKDDHLFVISDFPLPEKEVVLAGINEEFEFEVAPILVDARLLGDQDILDVLLADETPIIFWLGRNLLFDTSYTNMRGWKGFDFVNFDNIVFYDPTDKTGVWYSLSDFDLPDTVDSWDKISRGWQHGRYGARKPKL